ncbi:WxL domain-containing protein [Enterococcus sp. LJL120]
MKLRRLSAAALVAVIGAGVAFPAAVSAASDPTVEGTPYAGEGNVTITGGTIDPTDPVVPDPEIPGIIDPVPEIPINPTPGNLGIKQVSTLDFGDIATGQRGDIRKEAASIAVLSTPTGSTTPVETERGNFVLFEDARGNRAGYTISAELTQQFTLVDSAGTLNTNETLEAASISYTNGIVSNPSNTSATTPSGMLGSFDLELGVSQNVASAAEGEGSGEFLLEYGQSTDYSGVTTSTAGNSVFLNIPAETSANMLTGNYEAVITWTIVNGYTDLTVTAP